MRRLRQEQAGLTPTYESSPSPSSSSSSAPVTQNAELKLDPGESGEVLL